MQKISLVIMFAAMIHGLPLLNAVENEQKPIKALMVTGGCCHDYERQKLILSKGISARIPIEWTIVHQGGSTTNTKIPLYENPDWAKGFDVVIHNECFADVKDISWVDGILKPHKEGTPAVLIHCAMHCYRTGTDKWFEFTGVQSPGHGPHYGYKVENLKKDHPIMQGFGDSWDVNKGELYHTVKLWPRAVPLAQAPKKADNTPQVTVWTNEYGKGKVFATTIGHYNETMVDPKYLDMVSRGILWSTGKDQSLFKKTNAKIDEEIKAIANMEIKIKPIPAKQSKISLKKDNLAFEKPVKASSEEKSKNNFAKNATDGDISSRWCASSGAKGEWLEIDLGKLEKLNHVRIHWESNNAYQYKLEASANQKDWVLLDDLSTNKKKQKIYTHAIEGKEARYLKVTFLGSGAGSWGSIWEIEAYSGKLPDLPKEVSQAKAETPATLGDVSAPDGFDVTIFGKPPEVNYPVCIAAGQPGELFIGVDEQGSLGKEKGKGKIIRAIDKNNDGIADEFQVFANVDHPRGIIYFPGKLWVLHPPFLTLFEDSNLDGKPESQKTLLSGISTEQVFKRGADHTTNNIQLGIDGWIYIAVGDFGFSEAKGTDGKVLSRRGGGIARVRPDGTNLEIYAWGLRNVLDVCIDPFMNMYTRDNTNDGGGWNVRVSKIFQGAEYGYPNLYMNYPEESMPPLGDYGGGSGCGGTFVFDRTWPAPYSNAAYTSDWGRSEVYIHALKSSGATVTPHQETFLKIPRPTDLDIDSTGALYASSWKNGSFNYSGPNVGFVARITPKNWKQGKAIDLGSLSSTDLVDLLKSDHHSIRLMGQQEILRRNSKDMAVNLKALTLDSKSALENRVAAIFTLKQLLGKESHEHLISLCKDSTVAEFALRAITDRLDELPEQLPSELIYKFLKSDDLRLKAQTLISISRMGKTDTGKELIELTQMQNGRKLLKDFVQHTQHDPDRVIPHLAIRTLVSTKSIQPAIDSLESNHSDGAAIVLKQIHDNKNVSALIQKYGTNISPATKEKILAILARLYFKEGDYKGDWWGTRPDTTGPYYERQNWAETSRIEQFLANQVPVLDPIAKSKLASVLVAHKVPLPGMQLNPTSMDTKDEKPIVISQADPNNPKLIGNQPYEKVRDVVANLKGNPEKGKTLFTSQSCISCHTDSPGQAPKGPHLVDIGKRYKRVEIIESILKPEAKIAQGFETFAFITNKGKVLTGFVVLESSDQIAIRQTNGVGVNIPKKEIEERNALKTSMMPNALANNLTPEQLADLIAYLESLTASKTN